MICFSPGLFLVPTAEPWEVWHLSPFRWVAMHRGGWVQRGEAARLGLCHGAWGSVAETRS